MLISQNNPIQYTNNHGQPRLVYDEAKSSIFRNQLSTCDCVLSQLIDNVNIGHVDSIVQSFTNFVYDCAACAYCKTGEGKKKSQNRKTYGSTINVFKLETSLNHKKSIFEK